MMKEPEAVEAIREGAGVPDWTRSPHSEVSHLALYVGALSTGLHDLHFQTRSGPTHPGATTFTTQKSWHWKTPRGDRGPRAGGTRFIGHVRAERLRAAHAEAVAEIERDRKRPGNSPGINGQVGNSILEAGALALTEDTGTEASESKQFVVAAPPGTGKTSHAIALMAATVRTADTNDLSKPHGCLFVVDQIKKADDMFQQINKLLPGLVAVWTTDHDVNSIKPTQIYVPPERRFHVDQLEQHAVAVVTQAFLRGPRGDKARHVIRGDHKIARALTIFDEQTREVDVYDVKQSEAIAVKEAIERSVQHRDVKMKMEPLLDFIHVQSKRKGNTVETPNDDPEGWRVARDLAWFAGDEAEQFVLSNSREIKQLDKVFGFAAQMHNNCAFIYRRGGGDNGSHFMAYVPVATPTGNSVLLDATADIDQVSELCPWRVQVSVPQVRYDNLHVVHAEPYTRENLTDFFVGKPIVGNTRSTPERSFETSCPLVHAVSSFARRHLLMTDFFQTPYSRFNSPPLASLGISRAAISQSHGGVGMASVLTTGKRRTSCFSSANTSFRIVRCSLWYRAYARTKRRWECSRQPRARIATHQRSPWLGRAT